MCHFLRFELEILNYPTYQETFPIFCIAQQLYYFFTLSSLTINFNEKAPMKMKSFYIIQENKDLNLNTDGTKN